ncbi:regulatory protein ArsR [Catenulispora acidiphila DSM 44928]|uniref:Regulatory protein ArsR n=1 Tax=Catenulispora acidiphila (strain DSM 44928 / JCM 14897 / NBRC 102108 / NRRL B-24433 / ID139908) TaxID=479433 RepID=C7QGR0_CATAD|nr:regulatory protein ArsR [Catenulispora acidiphila DSM 44928]
MQHVDTLTLLLHPVRLRIVHAMAGDRTRTTAELCEQLADVPKTTVYRHVGLLADGGVLDVVDEQRVHGAVERRYRMRGTRARIGAEEAAGMSVEDHRRAFAAAVAALLASFSGYLDGADADPAADSVGYRQIPLWLNPAELAEMIEELQAGIVARAGNQPTPDRGLYLLSPIFFPIEKAEDRTPDRNPATDPVS